MTEQRLDIDIERDGHRFVSSTGKHCSNYINPIIDKGSLKLFYDDFGPANIIVRSEKVVSLINVVTS